MIFIERPEVGQIWKPRRGRAVSKLIQQTSYSGVYASNEPPESFKRPKFYTHDKWARWVKKYNAIMEIRNG